MSWDLGISSAGDLVFSPGDVVFSASADLSGISGVDLIEQRMMMRMKVQRGSWTYDADGSFGSQLYRLASMTPAAAQSMADSYVREALREMKEIQVGEVHTQVINSALVLIVDYHILNEDISLSDENAQRLEITIAGGPA